jgi:hypothetical protein
VRRLYDIANVFTSLELIEKIHLVQTRKPAFKWLGSRVYPLVSIVPREAYTSDTPLRRPTTRPGFDAIFPVPLSLYAPMATAALHQPPPPPVPRRATIDTASLASKQPANESLRLAPSTASSSVPGSTKLPEALSALTASFEQFEAIKTERVKRTQFDVSPSPVPAPGVKHERVATNKVEVATPTEPSRTSSFARVGRTPSAVAAQHASVLNMASSSSGSGSGGAANNNTTGFDPLLLAYARVPPMVSATPAVSDAKVDTSSDSTAALSARAGFPLESSAYIRDSSDFLRQYRSVCAVWQKKMPTFKHLYLKHTFAPPTPLGAPATTMMVK